LRRKERLVFKQTPRSPLLDPLGGRSKWNVYTKYYLEDRLADGTRPRDVIEDITNDKGAAALRALGLDDAFPFAKPVELIQRCLSWLADPDALCLDFFAGSGTTGHAVLAQNARDGGRRRYVLVQLPEPLDGPGFPTIAHVTQERMRRAGRALGGDAADDRGFRVFRLAESNLTPTLAAGVDRAPHARTDLDLLYEVVLKSGYPLSSRIERITVAGTVVHRVGGGGLLVCFEPRLDMEAVRGIAALTPERVVLLECAFAGNDHLKANAAQIFRASGSALQTV
jgi:adenine-specific DNA-methyltransferase